MNLGLKGKVAIVTGAGRGIGHDVAVLLASEGAKMVINELDQTLGEALVQELEEQSGNKAYLVLGDVSLTETAKTLAETALREYGRIDILINNAGISPKLPFEEITAEMYDKVMAVNARSVFLCTQAVVGPMKEQKSGSIVNLCSTAGIHGTVNSAVHYSASKGAIFGMTNTLSLQLGPHNIRVNCVAPGRIDTAMTRMLTPEKIQAVIEKIPLGRLGTTKEVASVIVFLASDGASYLNGNCIEITGAYKQATLK